ncbi:MAG: iron-containing alcohol dehydrogenase [Sorangiineae bacterium PRO1]|nr:iron-containing alcohol dehydrogenase [Sorangiineae bacterium PRO1]
MYLPRVRPMLSDKVFEIEPGVQAHFGCGSVEKLPRAVRALERERAILVTDPGVEQAGVVSKLKGTLEADGILVEISAAPRRIPSGDRVATLVARVQREPRSAIVAVGGGSVIDTAKAVALLAPNGGSVSDFPPGCRPARPGLPVIAIPTTAGSGSETNMFAHLLDPRTQRLIVIGHQSVLPARVVLDPELSLSLPPDVTATTGFDALTHAIEAFTSNRHNPFSDALALRAIAAIATYLPRAHDSGSDIEARSQMCFAAHLAGLGFGSSGLGLCHAMAHGLSARLDVTHGQALAALLPHVMRFNFGICEARYAQIAIALGVAAPGVSDAENAHRAISELERLTERVGLRRSATELGVDRRLCAVLAQDAMADVVLSATPRFPDANDVLALYEAAL